ncbi:MAG: XTP/dITP diphosphatase [Bacillota bacterium]|nr:XTP/dITP diphosphatase [Bacillota bacterium]
MGTALVVASRNRHKVEELRQLLAGLPVEVRSLADYPEAPEVVEDGDTFAENAVKKARAAVAFTGEWALADDSGLEVDALGGEPGVRSARFAGEPRDDARNNAKLLALLAAVPPERRTARFRCVVALAGPGGELEVVEGAVEGRIVEELRGTGGFGYDPLFLLPDLGRTMAELTPEEKNLLSHRGRAMAALATQLRKRFSR